MNEIETYKQYLRQELETEKSKDINADEQKIRRLTNFFKLEEGDQNIFILYFINGTKYNRIAKMMNVYPELIKKQITRIEKLLEQ